MCFDVQTSLITGSIGLATCALAVRRHDYRFAGFWLCVTSMQFLEAAIHATSGVCDTPGYEGLRIGLHLALCAVLAGNALGFVVWIGGMDRTAGRLLMGQSLVLLAMKANEVVGYLRDGVTHDILNPGLELIPGHDSFCMTPGPGGHLWWNQGFVNAQRPFQPPYVGALLCMFVPGCMWLPRTTLFFTVLQGLCIWYAGNASEGGSVWCVAVHLMIFVELGRLFFPDAAAAMSSSSSSSSSKTRSGSDTAFLAYPDNPERRRVIVASAGLSERATAAAAASSGCAYVKAHIERLSDPSYTCCAIAENKICFDLLEPLLADAAWPSGRRFEATQAVREAGYDDPRGSGVVRGVMSQAMSLIFKARVDPEELVLGAGVAGIIKCLLLTIADPGQACLVPEPHFAGYDSDLSDPRVGLERIGVRPDDDCSVANIDAALDPAVLTKAAEAAKARGVRSKVLLLTNPHNPTGRCYSAEALRGAIAWARTRRIHVIVDAVYAGSVHEKSGKDASMFDALYGGKQDSDADWDHVHILWGLAKDFGLAGWRVGTLYSRNATVRNAVASLVHGCEASTHTLAMVARALEHTGDVKRYLDAARGRLRAAHDAVCAYLEDVSLPHVKARAGIFILLDLGAFLDGCAGDEDEDKEEVVVVRRRRSRGRSGKTTTTTTTTTKRRDQQDEEEEDGEDSHQSQSLVRMSWAAETRLWREMLEETGVNLTPGKALHCPRPGFFRLCFAYSSTAHTIRAIKRVGTFLRLRERRGS